MIIEAIKAAGFTPGQDIALALDPAASSFYEQGAYNLAKSGQGQKTSAQMTELYKTWVGKYHIVSVSFLYICNVFSKGIGMNNIWGLYAM